MGHLLRFLPHIWQKKNEDSPLPKHKSTNWFVNSSIKVPISIGIVTEIELELAKQINGYDSYNVHVCSDVDIVSLDRYF